MVKEREDERKLTEKTLHAIEKEYGFIPVISQVLSERPDLFLPSSGVGRAATEGRGELDRKTRYLVAMASAAALGSEHCIGVQMDHAIKAGATRDEILEALYIASYMGLTRSQSYSLRKFREKFPEARDMDE